MRRKRCYIPVSKELHDELTMVKLIKQKKTLADIIDESTQEVRKSIKKSFNL